MMARLKMATNFYTTPEEVSSWLADWQARYQLHAVFGRVFPSPAVIQEVDWKNPGEVLNLVSEQAIVCLSTGPLQTDLTSINPVPFDNPDCLRINLPKSTGDRLKFGTIISGASDPASVKIWKAILKDLVGKTNAGAWYALPGRKKWTLEPEVRFSPGAAALFHEGIRLVGGGKTVVAQLGLGSGTPPAEADS
jgi:hypothetical protein